MTDSDWLSRRIPPPPADLAAAIREALKARNVNSEAPSPTELLEAAQSLLEKVLEAECATRDSALDLLTADALVTYALDAANELSEDLSDFPRRAMRQLAGQGKATGGESDVRPAGSRS